MDTNKNKLTQDYTLLNLWKESVKDFSDRTAVSNVDNAVTFTYGELDRQNKKISLWLKNQGVKTGDKIAILSENSPNWVSVFFAVTCMGAVAVPLLPDFSATEINNILDHSESDIIFISKRLLLRNDGKLNFSGKVVLIDNLNYLSESINEYHNNNIKEWGGIDITSDNSDDKVDKFEYQELSPDDIASLIYTSGTTGRSKGVMLSHGNLSYVPEKVLDIQNVDEYDSFLSILPLSHVYENVLGLILPLKKGAKIYYISKMPTPTLLMESLQKVKPTMLLMVPLIIDKIYTQRIKPELRKNRIIRGMMHVWPIKLIISRMAGKKLMAAFGGRIRFLGVGGAHLAPMTERFLKDAGFPYSCGYGLTETSSLIFGSRVGKVKFQSVGIPVPGVEYRIIKPKPSDRIGELIVRWDGNMKGYYKEPDKTASVLTNGNWFHTGDLVELNNGALYIKGRSKTMILGPSGENIYPEEIESVINRMEGVIESLVYEAKGRIVAKVYFNIEELSKKYSFFKDMLSQNKFEVDNTVRHYLNEMKAKLNEHLNKYSQVYKLELVQEPFEKTATHKIKRIQNRE